MSATVSDPAGASVSLRRLGELRNTAESLREALRSAFLDRGPRLEQTIFRTLAQFVAIYQRKASPLGLSASTDNDIDLASTRAESLYVALHYLQDILAACVLLMDERADSSDAVVVVEDGPITAEPTASLTCFAESVSEYYVSRSQRRFCKQAFFYFCWEGDLPLHTVLQALYPLLDPTVHPGEGSSLQRRTDSSLPTTSQNHIAPNILRHFPAKRQFIQQALNGLVLQSVAGVRALLHTLLLNDGVTPDLCVEASQYVARLLLSKGSMASAWIVGSPASPIGRGSSTSSPSTGEVAPLRSHPRFRKEEASQVSQPRMFSLRSPLDFPNDQIRLVAEQHISLFEELAEVSEARDNAEGCHGGKGSSTLSFLAKIQRVERKLPEQTIEERLHLYLAVWLNQALYLPSRTEAPAQFAECYERFFAINKSFLTPAFGHLSLRLSSPAFCGGDDERPLQLSREDEEEAFVQRTLAALRRLHSLAHGCALGAASRALVLVLEAVMPGLLNLTACAYVCAVTNDVDRAIVKELEAVWRLVFENEAASDVIGRIMVKACTNKQMRGGEFAVSANRVEGAHLRYVQFRTGGAATDDKTRNARWLGLLHLFETGRDETDEPCRRQGAIAIPAALRHSVLTTVIEECTQALCRDELTRLRDGDYSSLSDVSGPALASFVESATFFWPADCIFGPSASLDSVLDLVAAAVPISTVSRVWALQLIPRVMAPETLRLDVESIESTEKNRAHVALLLNKTQKLSRVLSSVEVDTEAAPDALPHAATALEDAEAFLISQSAEGVTASSAEAHYRKEKGAAIADLDSPLADAMNARVAVATVALDTQSTAMVSLAFMQLAQQIETISLTRSPPFSSAFYAAAESVLHTLLRCLQQSSDACAVGHAVRGLVWLAMYRLDSTHTTTWSQAVVSGLLASRETSPRDRRSETERTAQQARLKTRLLDALLSLCDYDTDGRTLRNVDDYCHRADVGLHSLYRVLASLCQSTEASIVQVAALHLLGPYATTVFPRVSLSQVCQLCQDVFRHTHVEMAKAAGAAMLRYVTEFLLSAEGITEAVPLSTLRALANAMATYHPQTVVYGGSATPHDTATAGADDDAAIHAEVVRQNGRRIVDLLSRSGSEDLLGRAVVEEL